MGYKIFLSHAVKDLSLVEHFIEFLQLSMDINRREIYCTSANSSIPTGQDFVNHIMQNVKDARLVILLITESFLKSHFCLSELGATWALRQDIYPIIVPPLNFNCLDSTPIRNVNAIKINSEDDLDKMSTEFSSLGIIQGIDNRIFNKKKKAFLDKLEDHYTKVDNDISPEAFRELQEQNDKLTKELDARAYELSQLKDLIQDPKQVIANEGEEIAEPRLSVQQQSDMVLKTEGISPDYYPEWTTLTQEIKRCKESLSGLDDFVASAFYHKYKNQKFWFNGYNAYPQEWSKVDVLVAEGYLIKNSDEFNILPNEHDPAISRVSKNLDALIMSIICATVWVTERFKMTHDFDLDIGNKRLWEKLFDVKICLSKR